MLKQVQHDIMIAKLTNTFLLIIVIITALFAVILLSHATWFPNLLQIVANNLDTQRFYQPTDEEYLLMVQNSNYCIKNEDCEVLCRPNPRVTDCNSRSQNIYQEPENSICPRMGCLSPDKLFTFSACEHNQCVINGF